MQTVATFPSLQRKFANLGARKDHLVPALGARKDHIAAGDSQAAVPFPTEIGRDFDLQ